MAQPLLEKQPVGQPGESVMVRLVSQLIGKLPLLDGNGRSSASRQQKGRLVPVGPARIAPEDRERAESFPVSRQNRRRPARGALICQSRRPVFVPERIGRNNTHVYASAPG